jgi:hypothetical protein
MIVTKSNVIYWVREIVLHVTSPLIVNGDTITNPWQVDPAWFLGDPAPVGMNSDKIENTLVPRINVFVRSVKTTASFTVLDLEGVKTVDQLQEKVWSKVKP